MNADKKIPKKKAIKKDDIIKILRDEIVKKDKEIERLREENRLLMNVTYKNAKRKLESELGASKKKN